MGDRLKPAPEFEASEDPDISIRELLDLDVDRSEQFKLRPYKLSICNQQNLSIEPNEDGMTQTAYIRFDFLTEKSEMIKGSITLRDSDYNQPPDIIRMEVYYPHINNTWRYDKDPDNPIYQRYTTVSLSTQEGDPLDLPGYRRIRKLNGLGIVFDKDAQKVTDGTKYKALSIDAKCLEICSYVLKTVLSNPSLVQQVDKPQE